MVDYPDLSNLSNSSGIGDLLAIPNTSYPFFWTIIIAGIWIVLTMSFYFREKSIKGKSDIISAMAVASLPCIMISTLGSLLGIVTITSQLPIIVLSGVIIAVWIFSK